MDSKLTILLTFTMVTLCIKSIPSHRLANAKIFCKLDSQSLALRRFSGNLCNVPFGRNRFRKWRYHPGEALIHKSTCLKCYAVWTIAFLSFHFSLFTLPLTQPFLFAQLHFNSFLSRTSPCHLSSHNFCPRDIARQRKQQKICFLRRFCSLQKTNTAPSPQF